MPYASLRQRALAYIIDYAFVQPYLAVGVLLKMKVKGPRGKQLLAFCLGMALWSNFYNRCILMGRTGQSWGKQMAGMTLVTEEDQLPMGLGKAMLREGGHLFDVATLGYGYVRPKWHPKGQTFADSIYKTVALDLRDQDNKSRAPEAQEPANQAEPGADVMAKLDMTKLS